ncbi:valine--tRNA ligase [Patescibacteria group bacterium]|nr:valine--tRNA ligase [Patescibacteria group bacterium]
MEPKYDHLKVEDHIYRMWEEGGYFKPEINPDGKPFTIILPPPNANADLHLGHALFTIEDILIRYHRMKGFAALWLPGLDHAGFETQFVFEKQLKKENKSRFDYDNTTLYKMIWDFVDKNKQTVRDQLKKLGFSLDWSREKFTLDPDTLKIVFQTFEKMRKEGLVYKGERIVNYCPRCGTAFSDLEVDYTERDDKLYFLNYGLLHIATTRPETIFADAAIAVNPKDKHYKSLIGKTAVIPLINKEIPIISDEAVDIKFGTGALKVTPAHDPLDFEIGNRHDLPQITIIDFSGRLNSNVPEKYRGLKVEPAREAVVTDLKENGFLVKEEPLHHSVGICYKCKGVIEPLLQKQWFVKTKPLAKPAIDAVKNGEIKILPKSFEKTYFRWMENIRDWNISRQIVWGAKVPIEGETDTFDTWFSSGQWPFSTLMTTKPGDFEKFYPTTVMETGYDILFFWVARMIMLGLYVTGKVPFKTVYLHGLVRDKEGQKMSKSKGNVINPLDMVSKYGADALRFSLVANVGAGQDQRLFEEKIIGYRNFTNKLWNIGRFILGVEQKNKTGKLDKELAKKLAALVKKVTRELDAFKLGVAAEDLYQFTWHEFADKYLEDYKKGFVSYTSLLKTFETLLKLLHPFIPFVTEELWGLLPDHSNNPIIIAPWPR